jgi:hypothetical protein
MVFPTSLIKDKKFYSKYIEKLQTSLYLCDIELSNLKKTRFSFKNRRKSPRKSPRKSRRKSPRKSRRKSPRKSRRKSPRKSRRKSPRKSRRKSPRN